MITDVYTIKSSEPIINAMRLFVDKQISGCPIVDESDKFVGYISDGDIFRFLATNNTNFKTVYSFLVTDGVEGQLDTKLKELLTMPAIQIAGKELYYLTPNQDLSEACNTLATSHKKKVVVLDNDKIVGIITRSAITKLIMSYSIQAYEKENKLQEK